VSEPVLRVRDLVTTFPAAGGRAAAVDGVSFELVQGEVLALVGESGCGKSVTALSLLRLVPKPGRIESGSIRIVGREVLSLPLSELRSVRGKEAAMIFQEPMTSLSPVVTVGAQVREALQLHEEIGAERARARTIELFDQVGIPDAAARFDSYPHELSGGLKQRVMIAMALALQPKLLIADEPTTALDVTIQAQILKLMADLKRDFDTAIIMITHDLGVVAGLCDRVMVMYAGRVAETGSVRDIFYRPQHPYSLGLLQSMPRIDEHGVSELAAIPGQPPNLQNLPQGCNYQQRCPFAFERCRQEEPALRLLDKAEGRAKACHLERLDAPQSEKERAPA
jgi:oligopeptide transport system ATP-binding protein